jgi:hypothetical protein
VDLDAIAEFPRADDPDYEAQVLSVDPQLRWLAFAAFEKRRFRDVRIFLRDLRGNRTLPAFQCASCFYTLRYNTHRSGIWLDDGKLVVLGDSGRETPWSLIRISLDHGKPVVEKLATYRGSRSFMDPTLLTPDSRFLVTGSLAWSWGLSWILDAASGRRLYGPADAALKLDLFLYRGDGRFVEIRVDHNRRTVLGEVTCGAVGCAFRELDEGPAVEVRAHELVAVDHELSGSVGGGSVSQEIDRRPTVVIYDLDLRKAAKVILPGEAGAYLWGYDAATDVLTAYSTNALAEGMESRIDLKSARILDTKEIVVNPYRGFERRDLWARSRDGSRVPVVLLYPKGTVPGPDTRLLVYGYGEFGTSGIPAWMWTEDTELPLRLGMAIAFARVRGGRDLGEDWYQGGTLYQKHHAYEDFEASVEALHRAGVSRPARTSFRGYSSGGGLVAAVAARRPDLVRNVLVEWGSVDTLNFSMEPKSHLGGPFTWAPTGDARDPTKRATMCADSALQLLSGASAAIRWVVTTGLRDIQVPLWFPSAYYAKLQAIGAEAYLLAVDDAHLGHGSAEERARLLHAELSLMLAD